MQLTQPLSMSKSQELTDKLIALILINDVDYFNVGANTVSIYFKQERVNIGIITQVVDSVDSYSMFNPYHLSLNFSRDMKDTERLINHPKYQKVVHKSLFS